MGQGSENNIPDLSDLFYQGQFNFLFTSPVTSKQKFNMIMFLQSC